MDRPILTEFDYVKAALNYQAPTAEKLVAYNYEPPPGTPQRTGVTAPHVVPVYNARRAGTPPTLEAEGFALARHDSEVKDFYDEAEVKSVYYPELERLVKDATGAARVFVFDTTMRQGAGVADPKPGVKPPAQRVHNDYTEKSGRQRVRDLLGDEAEALLQHRFAIVNVWRPIRGPLRDAPLALCDARSIKPADFIAVDLKYRDRTGETYALAYDPAHRWYYYPDMAADEVVFIKCYDSARDGRARFTAHGAFTDPTVSAGVLPRESIEARTLVFFPPDTAAAAETGQ